MTNKPISKSGVGSVRISVLPITEDRTPRLGKFVTVTASCSPKTPYRETRRVAIMEHAVCANSLIYIVTPFLKINAYASRKNFIMRVAVSVTTWSHAPETGITINEA